MEALKVGQSFEYFFSAFTGEHVVVEEGKQEQEGRGKTKSQRKMRTEISDLEFLFRHQVCGPSFCLVYF